jgi:zinc transport system permease protein
MLEQVSAALGVPGFLVLAFTAGAMVSLLAGYYGAFVVQRGLGFLGNGLAHAAFGGVAIGVYFDVAPLAVAVPFTIGVACGIVWLRDHSRLAADTIIGIAFSLAMAIGIVVLSKTPRYTTDAFAYLFGSILSVQPADLWVTLLVVGLTAVSAPAWRRWAYSTFDRELALADKHPCRRDDYLLAASLAVTIVVAMKVVGIVLVAAFLVIPPATARLMARTFATMTVLSMVVGLVSVVGGISLAWVIDWPAGATIILVQSSLFAGAFAWRRLLNPLD